MLVWHSESISKDNNMGSEFKKAMVNEYVCRDRNRKHNSLDCSIDELGLIFRGDQ